MQVKGAKTKSIREKARNLGVEIERKEKEDVKNESFQIPLLGEENFLHNISKSRTSREKGDIFGYFYTAMFSGRVHHFCCVLAVHLHKFSICVS